MRAPLRALTEPARTSEPQVGQLLRHAAAGMALAAGIVHLAQVGVHFDEDWTFGAFFIVVGVLQLVGALYLVVPVGPLRLVRTVFAFGILGSLATIAIWVVSRAFGLPFGAEPGEREAVGLADAAADLFELFTAWLLVLWLRARGGPGFFWRSALGGALGALALLALWAGTRRAGVFDPDPRLTARPDLTDAAAFAFLILVALLFGLVLARRRQERDWARASSASVLVGLLVVELSLTTFTVPARGGQNLDCKYGPLADDSGLSHAKPPEPIALEEGAEASAVVLLLIACGDAGVELLAVEPLNVQGDAVAITRFAIDRGRTARNTWVAPVGGGVAVEGVHVEPRHGRFPVVVDVRAVREGLFYLAALRVRYVSSGITATIPFAGFVRFCVGHEACGE